MSSPTYYKTHWVRQLTQEECDKGEVVLQLDPYRLSQELSIGGGAREQIMKKALRWTTKGDDEVKVINEIISAAQRRLEMIKEDSIKGKKNG